MLCGKGKLVMKDQETKQPATLKHIAEKMGYSVNTISRALRDKDDIATETREMIQKTAREMGYINNMIASSLRLGYTKTIAVILGDVSNPHFGIMMKEIEEHARKLGYSSFLLNTNEDEELERKAIKNALNKNVDGIIICPVQKSRDNINFLKSTNVPFVLLGRRFDEIPTDYVVCNDELGGYQATKYLLDSGHKNILMVHAPLYIFSSRERLKGYKRALKERKIKIKPELIIEMPVAGGGCEKIFDDLFKNKIKFTAIFAFSDLLAWDIWTYFHKKGYKVPKDFSIIGFDHIQSRLSFPFQLNSVSSYKGRISIEAVNILVQKMNNKSDKKQLNELVIDTSLVEGETVISYHTRKI